MKVVHRLAIPPQVLSPQHAQGSIETSHPPSYLEVQLPGHPPKLAQQRPRGDGSSKAVVAGPTTVFDATEGEDCGRHSKMSWEEELPIPLQQYGGS